MEVEQEQLPGYQCTYPGRLHTTHFAVGVELELTALGWISRRRVKVLSLELLGFPYLFLARLAFLDGWIDMLFMGSKSGTSFQLGDSVGQ